jgi:hypothetical protein
MMGAAWEEQAALNILTINASAKPLPLAAIARNPFVPVERMAIQRQRIQRHHANAKRHSNHLNNYCSLCTRAWWWLFARWLFDLARDAVVSTTTAFRLTFLD